MIVFFIFSLCLSPIRSDRDGPALKYHCLAYRALHSFVYSMMIYVHYDPLLHMDIRSIIDWFSYSNHDSFLYPPSAKSEESSPWPVLLRQESDCSIPGPN